MRALRERIRANDASMKRFNERRQQDEAARRERQKRLWEGFSVGDTVILSSEMTQAEYGVRLSNDDGEAVLIDGVIQAIEGQSATVKIMRVLGMGPGGVPMAGYIKRVRREHIVRVHDGPPSYWDGALSAGAIQSKRDGKGVEQRKKEPVKYWEVDSGE